MHVCGWSDSWRFACWHNIGKLYTHTPPSRSITLSLSHTHTHPLVSHRNAPSTRGQREAELESVPVCDLTKETHRIPTTLWPKGIIILTVLCIYKTILTGHSTTNNVIFSCSKFDPSTLFKHSTSKLMFRVLIFLPIFNEHVCVCVRVRMSVCVCVYDFHSHSRLPQMLHGLSLSGQ